MCLVACIVFLTCINCTAGLLEPVLPSSLPSFVGTSSIVKNAGCADALVGGITEGITGTANDNEASCLGSWLRAPKYRIEETERPDTSSSSIFYLQV